MIKNNSFFFCTFERISVEHLKDTRVYSFKLQDKMEIQKYIKDVEVGDPLLQRFELLLF